MSRDRKIDFTDSEGRKLFSVLDRGLLQMVYGNGEEYYAICHYLDGSRMKIDQTEYLISEFIRRMEQNGISYAPA